MGSGDHTSSDLLLSESIKPELANCLPNFLVISPPKTGSTWLQFNLSRHPDVFIPSRKELKYFCSYHEWLDLNWYLNHFRPGERLVKGEASPSYALLPVSMIRQVHKLMPDLKLIFLMREPISRAWSHARHCHRYSEANFQTCRSDIASVPDDQWEENFVHDWPLANGDYLGQLHRWLAVFPRSQFYVGFLESIMREPETLLRELFAFLGVNQEVDLSGFPVFETILEGAKLDLKPAQEQILRTLLAGRTRQLAEFLKQQFNLGVPKDWSLAGSDSSGAPESPPTKRHDKALSVFDLEWDDGYLLDLLASDPLPLVLLVEEGYYDFNILLYRRKFYAVAQSLGPVSSRELDGDWLVEHQSRGTCFVSDTLDQARELVHQLPQVLLVEEGYYEFNILLYRRKYYAVAQSSGPVGSRELDGVWLVEQQTRGTCYVSDTLNQARELVFQWKTRGQASTPNS